MIEKYDLAIVGSGIAGSMLAAICARHGYSVLLLDSQQHPRFAIGESTVPRTSNMLRIMAEAFQVPEIENLSSFNRIREKVAATCGVKKGFGFVYHRAQGEDEIAGVYQTLIPPKPYGPENHLFRQDIDAYMMHTAVRYGACIRQGIAVANLDVIGNTVSLRDQAGAVVGISRYVVDASGSHSALARQLGLRENPTRFRHHSRALYTHMLGVDPYENVYTHADPLKFPWSESTLHHVFDGGWMWVIPFNNHPDSRNPLCSVGLNLDPRRFPRPSLAGEEEFARTIEQWPTVHRQFRQARAVRNWVVTDRLQYSSRACCADRFFLLAHASSFLNPLFSRGLAITSEILFLFAERLLARLADDALGEAEFTDVAAFQQKLFDENDRLVNGAYISFRAPDLWHAWLDLWSLGTKLDKLRLDRVYYQLCEGLAVETCAGEIRGVPRPGMLCPNDSGYARIFDDAYEKVLRVEQGDFDRTALAIEIAGRVKELPVPKS